MNIATVINFIVLHTGIAGIGGIIILMIGCIDILAGGNIVMLILSMMDDKGCGTLFRKLTCKSEISLEERLFCFNHYKTVKRELFLERRYRDIVKINRAYWNNDYDTLFEILLEYYQISPDEIDICV